jgi:DNA-nicking Smr family endonuclease
LSNGKRERAPGYDPSPEERALFRRLFADVRPLEPDVHPPRRRKPAPKARFARRDARAVLEESLAADVEQAEAANGDALSWQRPAVGRKAMRRLARGGYSVQADIDLHGMTAAEAKVALAGFLEECRDRGLTCVRVVHGKGRGSGTRGPVLKGKVDRWLRQWDGVLAFVSARQVDGGTGAVYVLLRR